MTELNNLFGRIEVAILNWSSRKAERYELYQAVEHEIDNVDTDELLYDLLKNKYEEFKKEDPEMSADDLDSMVMDNNDELEKKVDLLNKKIEILIKDINNNK